MAYGVTPDEMAAEPGANGSDPADESDQVKKSGLASKLRLTNRFGRAKKADPANEPEVTIDLDDTDELEDEDDGLDRRVLFGALAGAGVAVGGAGWWFGMRSSSDRSPEVVAPDDRQGSQAAISTPSDAGGFTNRNESLTAGGAADEPDAPPDQQLVWPTPAEAAENTTVEVATILATGDPTLHLLRRATFGVSPSSVSEVNDKGIDAWIAEQLDSPSINDDEADALTNAYPLALMEPPEIQNEIEDGAWHAMTAYSRATLTRQVWSKRQLHEVMVDFWSDHLHVAAPGGAGAWDTTPSYYNNVVREHALGSFTDMLLAADRHPAMLRYLDNHKSHKDSVNENLGRELLELHTVGVGSGYGEDDVRNSAYILTGRTVVGENDAGEEGTFVYDPEMHWTGTVKVLDFEDENSSGEDGLEVGDRYLRYLASHPATARSISRKLAVRFVSDNPPDALVDRLAEKYLESETSIGPVLDLMFRSNEFWAAVGQKAKRPLENHVATYRVLDVQPGEDTVDAVEEFWRWTGRAGHQPLAWRPPDGYPDVYPPWRSASGILETWNTHWRAVDGGREGVNYHDPDDLVGDLPRDTVGEYVDSMCQRLCQQTFQPEHRSTLIAFAGAGEGDSAHEAGMSDQARHIASLVLDSPYFALR